MIKELIYNTSAKIKSIDKKELVKKIKSMLHKYEVMFIYFSGSIAYDTFNPYTSDIDINVFIKGFRGYIHTDLDDYDLFIFGDNCLKERQELSEDLSDYVKLFIDDIYSLDRTLIYLNKKYEEEYEAFKNFKVESVMKKYMKNAYDYFMFLYVDSEISVKRFYHVIRIKGQLDHYLETGTFDLTISDEYKKFMLEFKNNFSSDRGKEIYANEIQEYLEDFRKFIEEE